jgi:cytochrome c nitrite reductase small subunit
VNADQLGPLFQHPEEPHYLWIAVVLLAIPSIAVALWGITRGHLAQSTATIGLVVLPAVAFLLGNVVVMQESTQAEFCGSCHVTMSPIVEGLATDNGSLASQHFRSGAVPSGTACYTCHSGYGIWGGVDAKMAGVIHMLHTVTGRYEYPLRMHAPFDISSCLGCHAESTKFRAQPAHHDEDIQRMLVSGEMGCAGSCHAPAHPDDVLMGVNAE